MEINEILKHCDHTLLTRTATWEEIRDLCDDGIQYGVASVCIPPCYVKQAKQYVEGKLPICTVIGFPNGYNSTEVKSFEAMKALSDGADELDMVINLGMVKAGDYTAVEKEIKALRKLCRGKSLKVIIETCYLTREEKVALCGTVTAAGADYIKTSTGFGSGGATFEDVALFAANVGEGVKIKAAGGISSLADAERFLELGADRLGTSRIVKIAKESR